MAPAKMDETDKLTVKFFGERLKELRLSKNLTQEEAAKSMDMTYVAFGNYERGSRLPTQSIRRVIAKGLGVAPEEIEDLLRRSRTEALLRTDPYLSPSSVDQLIRSYRLHREDDRRAMEEKRRHG